MPATCQEPTCRAQIDWAVRHDDSTKRMPVDHDSAGRDGGNLAVWRDPGTGALLYRVTVNGDTLRAGEHLATSHYKTCTKPAQFSKRAHR